MEWEVRWIEWMQGSFGDLSRTAGKIFAFIGGEAGLLIGVIAAIPFEEKYVGFKDTGNVFAMILRVIGAVVIFLLMNTLLKMPFNSEFLASARLDTLLIRTARYAVMVFVVMGVYPKVFPLFEKIKKS